MIKGLSPHVPSPRYIVLFITSIYLIIVGFGTQHNNGIVGTTRKNGNGCVCHNITPSNNVTVWVTGPATVNAGSSNVYTLHLAGGPAVEGGFNAATRFGSVSAATADVQGMSGEVTHVHPKSFAAGTVAWTFLYTAPATATQDTIYSVGNSVNDNLIPDNGDQWNYGNDFIINVIPAGAPIPILSMIGFCLLGILLVLSVVSFLRSRKIA
ncbi:MAG: hypothetical protein HY033_11940 [Ignavibacteriae bacterium]|nr:hypothetical protein [Ignavibacteriota bacterium]